jgi:acylphosphatase
VSTNDERWELVYYGRVQGVGFRHRACELARRYDVSGYVQNRPDGAVTLIVEGLPAEVGRLVDEIAMRLEYYIQRVDQHRKPATGQYDDFEIRY